MTVSPGSLNFGKQNIGITSGAGAVGLTSHLSYGVSFTMAITKDFSAVNNCGGVLEPGETCTIKVYFTYSGALVPVGTVPTGQDYPLESVQDPRGKFLYVDAESTSGLPTQISGSPFPISEFDPALAAVYPLGGYLFLSDQDGYAISAFPLDQTTGAISGPPWTTRSLRKSREKSSSIPRANLHMYRPPIRTSLPTR